MSDIKTRWSADVASQLLLREHDQISAEALAHRLNQLFDSYATEIRNDVEERLYQRALITVTNDVKSVFGKPMDAMPMHLRRP